MISTDQVTTLAPDTSAVTEAKPRNKEAAKRSRQKREIRVDEGVAFLQNFLLDLIRQGLGHCDFRDSEVWNGVSRRLIDCQAPGLAAAVTRIGELSVTSSETRLLHELAALYFLLQSYQKKQKMTVSEQAELDQRIGWPIEKESVLAGSPVQDDWFIVFRSVTKQGYLTVYSTWLFGRNTGRWALLLSFSAAGAPATLLWPVGGVVATELCFYPGVRAERALPVTDNASVKNAVPDATSAESITGMLARVSESLGDNPWRNRFPFLIRAQPVTQRGEKWLVDETGCALSVHTSGSQHLMLSSICGGRPCLLAGEWDGYHCHLYAVEDNGAWVALRDQHT